MKVKVIKRAGELSDSVRQNSCQCSICRMPKKNKISTKSIVESWIVETSVNKGLRLAQDIALFSV